MKALKIDRLTDSNALSSVQAIDSACFSEEPWDQTIFLSLFHSQTKQLYLSYYNELPCGYAVMQAVEHEGELERIGILPNFRNKGLGQDLLCHILLDLELDKCALEVSQKNMAAVNLYKKCGFQPVGMRHNYYPDGSDAWIMTWKRKDNELK